MKRSVDAVREAADDQEMLVGLVRSRIADNETHTDNVAKCTAACGAEIKRMIDAARDLNETTTKFVV